MSWISAKKPPEHYEECLVTWSGELNGTGVYKEVVEVGLV